MSSIVVVCALIFNEQGEVLMTKRRLDKLRPGMWEMPGGKVEPTDVQGSVTARGKALNRVRPDLTPPTPFHLGALQRELREELGVLVDVGPCVSTASFRWKRPCDLFLYHCLIREGLPAPLEADELRYVNMDYALDYLPMCPAQYLFYEEAAAYIERYQRLREDTSLIFGHRERDPRVDG